MYTIDINLYKIKNFNKYLILIFGDTDIILNRNNYNNLSNYLIFLTKSLTLSHKDLSSRIFSSILGS